ncbi:MAG: putative nucleic acid-binding protein [Rhodothermales bacterium]|jgi:predicted nucleic acid-binding protein
MVVDANVLAAYFLEPGKRREQTKHLFRRTNQLHAPALWRTEFLNVIRKYVAVRGLSRDAAVSAHAEADYELTTLAQADAGLILDLSRASDCSIYDCEYVAAAMVRESFLFTFDQKLIRAFPAIAREP